MKKKFILLSIAGVILIAAAIILLTNKGGLNSGLTGNVVQNTHEINLAVLTGAPYSAFIYIAEKNGYFSDYNLKINYFGFPTGKLALDAVLQKGADMATVGDVPIALAGLANQPISVVATIAYSNNNDQVVARRDAGISRPEDLKGKKIATTQGGGPLFFTYKFLGKYNITKSDINLVFLNPPDMLPALVRKDIDAFIVFQPFPLLAQRQLGDNAIIFAPDDIYGETWNIVTVKDYESSHDQDIENFIKALIRAEEFYNTHPNESLDIIANSTSLDRSIIENISATYHYKVEFNNILRDYLYEEAQWAMMNGYTSSNKTPNYDDIIDRKYLDSVDPQRVKI